MSATVRRIRPAQDAAEQPRVSTQRERVPTYDWHIESVFYPELAVQPPHTRRCTSCGYHGPMQRWFRHFLAPWLILVALTLASLAPGVAVLLVPQVNDWVAFHANPTLVGWGLLGLALMPIASFALRYAMSYKCPHCQKVGENH